MNKAVVIDGGTPSQSKIDTPGITISQNGVISSRNEGKPGKKFHNGWTTELESLATEWADNAACYEWMHQRSRQLQSTKNLRMKIPMIVLSTLTGTASFGLGSFFGTDEYSKTIAQMVIGSISILVGTIGTLDTFFQYAQSCEMHNTAAVNWGNFQRNIEFQMKLHPNERIDAMPFLKMMQNELNRLIEQSPSILECVLKEFRATFKEKTDLKKPAIVDGLEHTMVNVDRSVDVLYTAGIEERVQALVKEELKKQSTPEKESISGNSTPPTIVIRDV
jgi:hypothetical protein